MKNLIICHNIVPVILDDRLEEHGSYCETEGPEIRLAPQSNPAGSGLFYNSLFHEALHSILSLTGLAESLPDEELLVRTLEVNISRLFSDNPDFARDYIATTRIQAGENNGR